MCVRTHAHVHTRMCVLGSIQLFAILRATARQASPSMGFVRQEYWSGLPFPSPGDLPDRGIKPMFHALAGEFFAAEPTGNPNLGLLDSKIMRKYFSAV